MGVIGLGTTGPWDNWALGVFGLRSNGLTMKNFVDLPSTLLKTFQLYCLIYNLVLRCIYRSFSNILSSCEIFVFMSLRCFSTVKMQLIYTWDLYTYFQVDKVDKCDNSPLLVRNSNVCRETSL